MRIFPEFENFSEGVQFFVPDDEAAYAAGKPCGGFGSVRYKEGSVYCGRLWFDGESYNKLGFGRQDFAYSSIGSYNAAVGLRKAFFVGQFDYRKTDWIYGNGVLYYADCDNRPKGFSKGFFQGLEKTGEYEGTFDPALLAQGFTPDMEIEYVDDWLATFLQMRARADGATALENLFLGDSYFELWTNPDYTGKLFYDEFDNANFLNLGIGGTKFSDWMRFLPLIGDIVPPARIFLNLGFNDIHANFSAERVHDCYTEILGKLRERFPHAEYILFNVVEAPFFPEYYAEEERFNRLTRASSKALNVKIVDMRTVLQEAATGGGVFHEDGIHPNARGYSVYAETVHKLINGNKD